jgi:hypothetical protein
LLECWYQCICNLGAAKPAPVVPGLPAVIGDGTNRTDIVTNMTLPPVVVKSVVLPITQGECAKVANKTTTNIYQAAFTAANTTFAACEGSSDCPRKGDCCAAKWCMCMPYDNDKQRLQWCV